ncbi:hypothetical protein [Paenibacillus sp. YYML68]|uniref:hypothetical protein n=1 Tax=Paenibacillus sp. YYML68 TaxID=2909250 RepID=UPI0024911CE3|nr:hypothetical protein [Paenibacillus sp. YYML68]
MLHKLVSQKISLKEALKSSKGKFIHTHPNQEYLYDDIEKIYPDNNFYLTEILPNSVDIVQKRRIIQKQIEEMNKYNDQILIHVKTQLEKRNVIKIDYEQMLEKYLGLIKSIDERENYSVVQKGISSKIIKLAGGYYEHSDRIYTFYNN